MNPFTDARSVLFVHAHPDDETLSTGGLIRMLADDGIRVNLVTASRGERGEVVPELRDRIGDDPGELTRVRADELRRAVEVLGVAEAWMLGAPPARAAGLPPRRYLDSGMRWVTPTHAGPAVDVDPGALTAASPAEVIGDLRALLGYARPDLVVSYDDEGGYGHPDHRFIRRAALAAARAERVPFAEIVPHDAAAAWPVDTTDRLTVVQDALRAHATQLTVDGGDIVHSGGQRERITTRIGVRIVDA